MQRVRLVDLLDRIRPTGAPGALGDTTLPGDRAADRELTELRTRLLAIDDEAAAVLEAAHRRADEVVTEAHEAARRRRATIPDRVATAEGEEEAREQRTTDRAVTARQQEADDAITARRQAFERASDRLVAAAVSAVWADLGLGGDGGRP